GFLSGLPLNWVVFFASAIPVTELRLSIPFGIAMGMSPLSAWFWGVLGNMLPAPFLLLLWPTVYKILDKFAFTRKFLHKYVDKARRKGHEIEKYGALGLALFVGVPLPGTGLYTGSLMGFLLGLDRRYSFLAFTLGVVLAATIVTLATVGFVGIADTVGWIAALILLAVVALVWYWFHRRKKKRNQK
ncbi:MAG: small multi-drug export protein, partial [Clostridiales bacterium]